MMSEKIDQLATALCAFQSELQDVEKNAQNPFFKSSYADLSAVWNAVRPILAKHGLSVTQMGHWEANGAFLETALMHKSGQWISGSIPLQSKDSSMQAMGSAISYARRYGLSAILGVSQKDDDGNEASQPEKKSFPLPVGDLNNPGEVQIPFGKNKGKKIKDFSDADNRENLQYWTERLAKEGKPPSGTLSTFLEATEAWLSRPEEDIPL